MIEARKQNLRRAMTNIFMFHETKFLVVKKTDKFRGIFKQTS